MFLNKTISCSIALIVPLLLLIVSPSLRAQQTKPTAKREPIYNKKADAKADIAKALTRAKIDSRRVLIMFGGNGCGWCHKLHKLFKEDRNIAATLQAEYEWVMVDIDANQGIGQKYKIGGGGIPYLTVLDANENVLTNQETGVLEKGNAHDPVAVLAFLKKWQAEPLDALTNYKAALANAQKENKTVFVRIGSPSCGWCTKFDEFVNRNEIAKILEKDFILVKIDLVRMENGKAVAQEIRGPREGGIPWFAFMNSKGEKLATSDGPSGNIGFPAKDDEISHFKTMLTKTAVHMNPEQIDTITQKLREDELKRQQAKQKIETVNKPQ